MMMLLTKKQENKKIKRYTKCINILFLIFLSQVFHYQLEYEIIDASCR